MAIPAVLASPLLVPGLFTFVIIALWASNRLPEYLTALMFFAGAMMLHLAPPERVFAGFGSSAFWLVLSGFVIGTAIRSVGLADRVARMLAVPLAGSWPRMLVGVVALTYALAFVMPSNMGRIALLMPIVMALAERSGLAEGSKGRIALALAVGFGTFQLSTSILPANVPNMVMAGAAESGYGLHFSYLSYLALHAPILGALKGAVLVLCLLLLFPLPQPLEHCAKSGNRFSPQQCGKTKSWTSVPASGLTHAGLERPVDVKDAPAPWSAAEKRLAGILLVTLALWVTDSLHGISPAWVGLAAACLCLLPRIGFLTGDQFAAGVNVRTCLYIAGILGLAAVVSSSGLGNAVGQALLRVLPLSPDHPAGNFASLLALVSALNFVVTANGVPALFTPLAQSLADGTGWPVATVLMVQVLGYATPLLPYQASPIVVAMGMGKVPAGDGLRLCLTLAVVSFVLLGPLDYLWFHLLGWL